MSFIQVPIGKGITKFPKIKRSQPEEKFGVFPSIPSDRQFLKDLSDQDRLVFEQEDHDTVGIPKDIMTFVPNNGTTFYFIEGSVNANSGAGTHTVELISNDIVIEVATSTGIGSFGFRTPTFSLIGDGVKAIRFNLTASNSNTNSTLIGYIVKSPKT